MIIQHKHTCVRACSPCLQLASLLLLYYNINSHIWVLLCTTINQVSEIYFCFSSFSNLSSHTEHYGGASILYCQMICYILTACLFTREQERERKGNGGNSSQTTNGGGAGAGAGAGSLLLDGRYLKVVKVSDLVHFSSLLCLLNTFSFCYIITLNFEG